MVKKRSRRNRSRDHISKACYEKVIWAFWIITRGAYLASDFGATHVFPSLFISICAISEVATGCARGKQHHPAERKIIIKWPELKGNEITYVWWGSFISSRKKKKKTRKNGRLRIFRCGGQRMRSIVVSISSFSCVICTGPPLIKRVRRVSRLANCLATNFLALRVCSISVLFCIPMVMSKDIFMRHAAMNALAKVPRRIKPSS